MDEPVRHLPRGAGAARPCKDGILTGAEALQLARRVATTRWLPGHMNPEEREDIVQDALLSVWTSVSAGIVDGLTGALINNAIGFAAAKVQTRNTLIDPRDYRARQVLDSRVDATEKELDRKLTGTEVDGLADKIREGMAASRRPTEGFHRTKLVVGSYDDEDTALARDAVQKPIADPFTRVDARLDPFHDEQYRADRWVAARAAARAA